MPLVYQRHWICRDCARERRMDPLDRVHDESVIEPLCCFCQRPAALDLGRVAVLVVPKPRELPLFPDAKEQPKGKPALRVLRGGKVEEG
jgi:hypothetical protein